MINKNIIYFINLLKENFSYNDFNEFLVNWDNINKEIEYQINDKNWDIIKNKLNIEFISKENTITIKIK